MKEGYLTGRKGEGLVRLGTAYPIICGISFYWNEPDIGYIFVEKAMTLREEGRCSRDDTDTECTGFGDRFAVTEVRAEASSFIGPARAVSSQFSFF